MQRLSLERSEPSINNPMLQERNSTCGKLLVLLTVFVLGLLIGGGILYSTTTTNINLSEIINNFAESSVFDSLFGLDILQLEDEPPTNGIVNYTDYFGRIMQSYLLFLNGTIESNDTQIDNLMNYIIFNRPFIHIDRQDIEEVNVTSWNGYNHDPSSFTSVRVNMTELKSRQVGQRKGTGDIPEGLDSYGNVTIEFDKPVKSVTFEYGINVRESRSVMAELSVDKFTNVHYSAMLFRDTINAVMRSVATNPEEDYPAVKRFTNTNLDRIRDFDNALRDGLNYSAEMCDNVINATFPLW